MCGATLEAGAAGASAKSEDDKGPRTSSRVRQRTTSTQSGDVSSALTRVREELSGDDSYQQDLGQDLPTEAPGQQKSKHTIVTDAVVEEEVQDSDEELGFSAPTPSEGNISDPLGAYIEDLGDDQFAGPDDSNVSKPANLLPMAEPQVEPKIGVSHGANGSLPDSENDQIRARPTIDGIDAVTPAAIEKAMEQQARQIAENVAPETISLAGPHTESEGSRVIVESGARRGRTGPSFGKRREQGAVEQQQSEVNGAELQKVGLQNLQTRSTQSENYTPAPQMDRPPTAPPVLGVRKPASPPPANNPRSSTSVSPRASVVPVAGEQVFGRLAGWLISYDNPDGDAIELREGRFFATGRSLKGGDLVLEDPSVSTPHALIAVDNSGIVKIQDLMSENGVWLRQRVQDGGDLGDYIAAADHIEVAHGDWVRFGDVEFLVSLIPYVGVK